MMMDQVAVLPPPLPPKTRRSPPASRETVLSNTVSREEEDEDIFNCRFSTDEDDSVPNHVVKIQINPQTTTLSTGLTCDAQPCIRISVNADTEMIQNNTMTDSDDTDSTGYFFYANFNCGVMSSGQVSPSDTLDSGTCSDLEHSTPPPLPKKKSSGVSVTIIGEQPKCPLSLTSSGIDLDSDDNESNLSCDSLNNNKILSSLNFKSQSPDTSCLPQTLLQDIRNNAKLSPKEQSVPKPIIIDQKSYEERKADDNKISVTPKYESDMYYNFHLNENVIEDPVVPVKTVVEDESFAGYKDLLGDGSFTIRSAKGTVRGVKNRVRAGIATFLQINSQIKSYKDKEIGKVVVYTTTMGILRETYQACMKVKQILRTLLIKFEERDVFMSNEYQCEIKERMRSDQVLVPQLYVDGQHIGDAETVERLNETGELRKMLKAFKSLDACTPCKVCGGYRLLPCTVCNGSKKSVHRNHFTTEFVALKCMNCDEVGLVRCTAC